MSINKTILSFSLLISLIAVGCGGGSSSPSSTPTPTPSRCQNLPAPPTVPAPTTAEAQVIELLQSQSGQGRQQFRYNAFLAKVARERAQDMVTRGYFSHVNPDGNGPNYLVTQAGYVLPESYRTERDINQIESIAEGQGTANEVVQIWINSPQHRDHVLGRTPFFAEQTDYGVGYAANPSNNPSQRFWVIITAKPGCP